MVILAQLKKKTRGILFPILSLNQKKTFKSLLHLFQSVPNILVCKNQGVFFTKKTFDQHLDFRVSCVSDRVFFLRGWVHDGSRQGEGGEASTLSIVDLTLPGPDLASNNNMGRLDQWLACWFP